MRTSSSLRFPTPQASGIAPARGLVIVVVIVVFCCSGCRLFLLFLLVDVAFLSAVVGVVVVFDNNDQAVLFTYVHQLTYYISYYCCFGFLTTHVSGLNIFA